MELAEPVGRHSGRQYFSCAPKHGLFVKAATALAASECTGDTGRLVLPPRGPLFAQYFAGMEACAREAGVALCTPPPQRLGPGDAMLCIDMQYDFLPGGSFGVPEGNDCIQPIAGLIVAGAAAGGTMICTRDYHPHDHASFNTQGGPFPPHCLQGSRGSKLCTPIATAMTRAKAAYPETVDVVFKGCTSPLAPSTLPPITRLWDTPVPIPAMPSLAALAWRLLTQTWRWPLCTPRAAGHRHVDSFGAFPYPEQMAEGRLVQRSPPGPQCSFLSWTGAAQLHCSALHEDINAPPDVLAAEERVGLAERIGPCRALYITGLALDFCVCDTSLTAREAGYTDVYIVLDAARPSNVPPIGFLTPPADLFRKAHNAGVKFCTLEQMFPM